MNQFEELSDRELATTRGGMFDIGGIIGKISGLFGKKGQQIGGAIAPIATKLAGMFQQGGQPGETGQGDQPAGGTQTA